MERAERTEQAARLRDRLVAILEEAMERANRDLSNVREAVGSGDLSTEAGEVAALDASARWQAAHHEKLALQARSDAARLA
jgi:hypothetical protein